MNWQVCCGDSVHFTIAVGGCATRSKANESPVLVRHTENSDGLKGQESLHVLSMANALERAGDHAKNIAEETCHLATGHTVRHLLRAKDRSFEQLFLDWLSKQTPAKV